MFAKATHENPFVKVFDVIEHGLEELFLHDRVATKAYAQDASSPTEIVGIATHVEHTLI